MASTLGRIQRRYAAQCDGDSEHRPGVRIETLDNPGWLLQVDLVGTALEGRAFPPSAHGLEERADGLDHPSASDWHSVAVRGGTFRAAGDPSKLEFMLRAFLDWAEGPVA